MLLSRFFLLKGTRYSHVLRLTEPLEWGHGWPMPEHVSPHVRKRKQKPEGVHVSWKKHMCKASLEPGKRQ